MADPAIDWTRVLTHPLGLVGYVLFLLFGLVAGLKRRDERRWILPAALVAAGVALLGGLDLAFRDVDHKAHEAVIAQPATTSSPASKQQNTHVSQTSSGAGSPNVQGVQGDVTITGDQSGNKTPKTQAPRAKPKDPAQSKTQ